MSFSLTGVGIAITTLLEVILPMLGIDVPEGGVGKAVEGFFAFLGFVLMIWGQVRRPDVAYGILKK